MTDRLKEIKARLTAIREGYAVHIQCGGEYIPYNPLGTHYHCHGCGQDVSIGNVVEQMDPALSYVEDVEWLLSQIEKGNQ